MNKVKENVIENVDVNNNYKPLTEEKFKRKWRRWCSKCNGYS